MTDWEMLLDLRSRMIALEARVDGLEGADDDALMTPAEAKAFDLSRMSATEADAMAARISAAIISVKDMTTALAAFTPLEPPPE